MLNKTFARAGLASLYVVGLALPLYIFFHDRGGVAWLHAVTPQSALILLFPLLGLYAFTFVTWQILISTNLRWLRQVWPRVISLHRFQGGFALLFALLHPGFILVGFGLSNYLHFRYIAPSLVWWLLPAYSALTIMLLTVSTAFLAWRGRNIRFWRKLHKLNYLVFALVWLHSWFVGTDTHIGYVRLIWLLYLVLIIASTYGRYRSSLSQWAISLVKAR
jgi:predicted ferric reductase